MGLTENRPGLLFVVLTIMVLAACGGKTAEESTEMSDIWSHQAVLSAMERAFDWQIDNIVYSAPLPDGGFQDVSDTEWVRGAFFAGVMAAHVATGDVAYLAAAKQIS